MNFFKPTLIAPHVMIVLASLIALGCASTYKPVNLETLTYSREVFLKDSVISSYMHNLQYVTGNKYYTKKERKYGIVAIAVKVENRSSDTLVLGSDKINVFVNGTQKPFLMPGDYAQKVKQRVALHLLHVLWGPWALSWKTDAQGETDFKFIYIPVGAIVGIGNALRASNANKANLATLNKNILWKKRVAPGETRYGTIIVPAQHSDEINMKFVE